MTIINLFPTTIYETYYKDDLTPYINKCIELKDKIECGGNKWRKKPYNTSGTYDLFKDKFFKKIKDFFNEHVLIFTKTIGIKKVNINNGRLNLFIYCNWLSKNINEG